MRIDVSKFLFIGALSDKESFLQHAQEASHVEFIHPKKEKLVDVPKEAQRYAQAIKILRGYPLAKQEKHQNLLLAEEICHQAIELKQTRDSAEEKVRSLKQEIDRIKPFGFFSFSATDEVREETGRTVRYYCAKSTKEMMQQEPSLILIDALDGLDYFITIEKEPLVLPDLFEIQISQELRSLYEQRHENQKMIHICDEKIKALTCYNWLLHYAFYKKLDHYGLDFFAQATEEQLEEKLFTLQGWVPHNKRQAVQEMCHAAGIFCEEVKIEDEDVAPTYLENKRLARVGEDLVHIFDTPSARDKDPSLWLLICFSIFFAMIVGDAGYGLIFLITAAIIHFKITSKKEFTKRFLKLMTVLSIACIGWGFLTNSFFAISFSSDSPLRQYSLINWLVEKKAAYHFEKKDSVYQEWITKMPQLKEATDGRDFLYKAAAKPGELGPMSAKFADSLTMEFALFIGSIHLILGLLRYLGKNPVGAGWIAFIVGAYLYIPHYLGATSLIHFACGIDYEKGAQFGLQLLSGGVLYATLVAVIKQGLTGIFEVMTSIQIFSDVLSYLRIYALGLAGAIMSSTINDLAGSLPLFVAIIMMIFAHGINIILSIMGGTIHGLRLNFLEWYHYSFEGGGKRFKPLAIHAFE